MLINAGISISMDDKGSWRDNVFVERLWRSFKYEAVYLKAYRSVSEARLSIGHTAFYNGRRPHSRLDRMTPDQAYFTRLPQIAAAQTRQDSTYLGVICCSDKPSHLSARARSEHANTS